MLTSTYTLVALSLEQTTVRTALHSLVRDLRACPDDAGVLAPGRAAQLCAELRRVVDHCTWRKLEKFLVPALRRLTETADGLLSELEQLSRNAADTLAAAEACLDAGVRGVHLDNFRDATERCTASIRRRLEREEHELFPLARSVIRDDVWFAIANQMLAHDAAAHEKHGSDRKYPGRSGQAWNEAHGRRSAEAVMHRTMLSSVH